MNPDRRIRVSVIVPVFNPGHAFDDLIDSLDRQTLPIQEFEVLLCDDGSDGSTRERLDRVAEERPNVRVMNLPHSGWPGAPRNHGIDAAKGEYVYFVDQDDHLFDASLQRICDYADLHSSDVVVGREVGVGRRLPRRIFRHDVPRAVLGQDPLLEMLTPHKLFRTDFLRTHSIRFPEGRVRLEDHLFVMRSYFRADRISILASEPCYAWVKHDGSASASRVEPGSYFPHLETVLDLVEENTDPGPFRDRLLRHWFRGKILQRLAGRQMRNYPSDYREHLIDVVRPLALGRFSAGVDAGLSFPHRLRAMLLRADRRADLLRLADFEADLECRADVTVASWSRGGGLHLTIAVVTTSGERDAFIIEPLAGNGVPASMPGADLGGLPSDLLDATRRSRRDEIEVLAQGSDGEERLVMRRRLKATDTLQVAVDPLRIFARADQTRSVRFTARVRRGGWTFEVPLTVDAAVLAGIGKSPLLAGRSCSLGAADTDVLELRREGSGAYKDAMGRAVRLLRARMTKKNPLPRSSRGSGS